MNDEAFPAEMNVLCNLTHDKKWSIWLTAVASNYSQHSRAIGLHFWPTSVFIYPCIYVHVVPITLSINTAEEAHHLRNMEGPTTDAFIRHKRINSKQMLTPTTECFCKRSWNWHCSVKPNCLFNPRGVSWWVISFWGNYLWTSEH